MASEPAAPRPRDAAGWRALTLRAHRRLAALHATTLAQRAVLGRLSRAQAREARYLAAHPGHLRHSERRVHSQNGEDGLLEEAFRRLGVERGTFVEFGASDGTENCTRHLLDLGWSGVWIEGDPDAVSAASQVAADLPVRVVQDFLTVDGIRRTFAGAGVPAEPDLMVVDVDGNDWWLARELLRSHRPRAVLVEVNASMGRAPWIMPYDEEHHWDRTRWYGASLVSWARLFRAHGYVLAACESTGVNALFVRRADAPRLGLPAGGLRPRQEYVSPKQHATSYGHPVAPRPAVPAPRLRPEQLAQVVLTEPELHAAQPLRCGQPVFASAVVVNGAPSALAAGGKTPVRLAVRWSPVDPDAPAVPGEPERSELATAVPPGARRWCPVRTTAPAVPGAYTMTVTLVQEHVAWLDDVGRSAPLPPVQVRPGSE
jgi:hypothetical protein